MIEYLKRKNKFNLIILVLFFIIFIISAYFERNKMLDLYKSGIDELRNQEYQNAQEILSELGDYKDSYEQIRIAQILEQQKEICDRAMEAFNDENYENAIELFKQVENFKKSTAYIENYKNSIELFEQIDGFENSNEYIENANSLLTTKKNNEALYNDAVSNYDNENYISAIKEFAKLDEYEDSNEMLQKCRVELARLQQATTISAGIRSSVGMIRNGKVYLAGDDYYSWKPVLDTWNDIISISVKGNFVLGLKEDGTVVMAGKVPEYYVGTKTWTDVIAISAGQQYIVGLRSDGTIVAQGHNGDHQVDIDDWNDIVTIATGWRHTVGLDSNGEIHITGLGSNRQLEYIENHKNDWKNIVDIDAGGGASGNIGTTAYTVALKQDGTVVTTLTGEAAEEVEKWEDIIAISAGDSYIVGLKSDNTIVTTQTEQSLDEINKDADIVAISAGYGFTLVLKSGGSVAAIGYNYNGQINVDTWEGITKYEDEWNSIFDEALRWNEIK